VGFLALQGEIFKTNTAKAVFLRIEIEDATGDGRLNIWPSNEHNAPTVGSIRYGASRNTTSSVIVSLCDEENLNPCSSGDVVLQTESAGAEVSFVVLGYFKDLTSSIRSSETGAPAEEKSTESPYWESGTGGTGIHYSDGNVGIGVGDPTVTLDVRGEIQGEELKIFREEGGGSSMALFESKNTEPPFVKWRHSSSGGDATSYGYIQVGEFPDGEKRFRFVAENGANFLFKGRVGIGTTADEKHPLTLLGNYAENPVGITQNQVGGDSTMELTTKDGSALQATRFLLRGDTDTADAEFYRGGRGSETLSLLIDGETGNVGIGAQEPQNPLSIRSNGGVNQVGITQNQVGGGASMELTTEDGGGQQATRLMLRGGNPTADIEFYRGGRGAEELSLLIEGADGNVGVGTAAPQSKLDVAGDIRLTGSILSDGDICIGECGAH